MCINGARARERERCERSIINSIVCDVTLFSCCHELESTVIICMYVCILLLLCAPISSHRDKKKHRTYLSGSRYKKNIYLRERTKIYVKWKRPAQILAEPHMLHSQILFLSALAVLAHTHHSHHQCVLSKGVYGKSTIDL
jgi:hypothetical protein